MTGSKAGDPPAAGPFRSVEAWRAEAVRLFGVSPRGWRFRCPICGHVASLEAWRDAMAAKHPDGDELLWRSAAQTRAPVECLGRLVGGRSAMSGTGPGPCDYAGYGLFRIGLVTVHERETSFDVFPFDNPETPR